MRLDYKTPEMGDPRGKPKVYFSCHPADFSVAFPLLPDDILSHSNCAIWYDTEPAAPYEEKDLFDALDGMQLVVFGVTSRFLKDPNRAREKELPYALKQHIPILPILLEKGLEYEFNEKCAEVQLVNKYISDSTATPYEEVLEKFLKSVLIGDDLAEKVRDAFDAYVFLSYRKKDRRHAQRLMHLIHENPQFRDIAIWYDEYLVPGEKFNDAIKAAFDKSGLFALAVTPHLLEPQNYVMQVEYPLARDRKKEQRDMEIVPVEMYEIDRGDERTDLTKLSESYREIPAVKDEHNHTGLATAFTDALEKISKKENDGSSRHRFFIGLAYLCGIDVEVNHQRALGLITSAAEDPNPCFDATDKLVDMYQTGDGVELDAHKALEWQIKLMHQYRREYEKNYSPDEHKGFGTKTFRALIKLSDMQRALGAADDAMRIAEEALKLGSELKDEVGTREVDRDTAVICNRIGSLYRDRGDYKLAMKYYQQALGINERLSREIGTVRARRDLSISLERVGDLYRKLKDPVQAEQAYCRSREIRKDLAGDMTKPGPRRDLSSVLVKLGNIRKSERDLDGALGFFREAAGIDRVLAAEMKTDQAMDDYAVSLLKIGDILRKKGDIRESADYYRKAVEIFSDIADHTCSLRSRKSLATALEKLTKSLEGSGQRETADRCLNRALRIRKDVAAEEMSHDTLHELAVAYYQCGEFHRDSDAVRNALELWRKLSSRHPEYQKYVDSAQRLLQKLT